MTKEQFKQILKANLLIPAAVFENTPDMYRKLSDHIECGANILIAPTYLYDDHDAKKDAYLKTQRVASDLVFVCNGIYAPTERTVFSGGTLSFDAYYQIIKDEADFLYKNCPGSVMFLLGFHSLAEAKYAVLAVREVCDLPVCVVLDFQNDTKLSDGFDGVSSLLTLQALGISAMGVMAEDCDVVMDILLELNEFTTVPLCAFPQANSFITPVEYAQYAHNFVNNKCAIFGAGKGADARFTAQIAKEFWQLEPFAPDFPTVNAICGKNQICFFDFQNRAIGKKMQLLEIDLEKVTDCNEVDAILLTLTENDLPPVCFSTKDIEVLTRAIIIYPGRACVKSDEYGEITAKEYGAMIFTGAEGEE